MMLHYHRELWPECPCYISENGYGKKGEIEEPSGEVLDVDRKEYLRMHLEACQRALAAGTDLRGYFCWSLLDNFEWNSGYSVRFGLVRVNYTTQQRTIKLSGRYYADVIRARRVL
jgi:beta-glucosidase